MASKEIEHELAIKIKDNYNFMDIVISDEIPYTLYCANDFKTILNIKNIKEIVSKYESDKRLLKKGNTARSGIQTKSYLNYNGLMYFLATRKKIEALDFCKICNIKLELKFYSRIEFDTIKCILDAFSGEIMVPQYIVIMPKAELTHYRIDLYFPDYKLAIECDENHTNIDADIKRENDLKDQLNCTFIRYKPYDKNFNIFLVINKIYKSILLFKNK